MGGFFAIRYQKWKSHPRRRDLRFLLKTVYRQYFDWRFEENLRHKLLVPPLDPLNIEVLEDEEFRASVKAVQGCTLLDVGQLANLWALARRAGPGVFLEVGSYRGGGALHICNAVRAQNRHFYSFDPFEDGGFESISAVDLYRKDQFTETSHLAVQRLLAAHPNARAVKGFFPEAAKGLDLQPIAFCHLDVDVYPATRDCLNFLAPRLGPKSFIVLDDVYRRVSGVQHAIDEFLAANPSFLLIPMFPGQGVLLSAKLWA